MTKGNVPPRSTWRLRAWFGFHLVFNQEEFERDSRRTAKSLPDNEARQSSPPDWLGTEMGQLSDVKAHLLPLLVLLLPFPHLFFIFFLSSPSFPIFSPLPYPLLFLLSFCGLVCHSSSHQHIDSVPAGLLFWGQSCDLHLWHLNRSWFL